MHTHTQKHTHDKGPIEAQETIPACTCQCSFAKTLPDAASVDLSDITRGEHGVAGRKSRPE